MSAAEKNIMKPRGMQGGRREPSEFDERVVEVQRISRVVKGGRRIRFRALVVIGDHKGRVGMGVAKANDVSEAVRKSVAVAKKRIITVPIIDGTIPYEVTINKGSVILMLKPASTGTSIVAGGSIRIVAELAGITDILAKSMGSPNKINNVTAAIVALSSFNPDYVERVRRMVEKKRTPAQISPEVTEKIEEKAPVTELKPTAEKAKKETKVVKKETKKTPTKAAGKEKAAK